MMFKNLVLLSLIFSPIVLWAQNGPLSEPVTEPAPLQIEEGFFDNTEDDLDGVPDTSKLIEEKKDQAEIESEINGRTGGARPPVEEEEIVDLPVEDSTLKALDNLTIEKQSIEKAMETPISVNNEPLPQIKRQRRRVKQNTKPTTRFIRHPLAKKGLIKINKDKVYIYKTEKSKQDAATHVRLGFFEPSNLSNPANGNPFSLIYTDSSAPMVLVDYEWQLFKKFGKLGLQAGGGFFISSGKGRFENGTEAPETFTFFAFPVTGGVIYRAKYWDNQWLVPYASGGAGAMLFAEHRDDDKNPSIGAALGAAPIAYAAGGGAFDLTSLGGSETLELDREYGINSLWLTVEFRLNFALSNKFDFSGNFINGGILAEF